jgi:hypothetical protein
MLKFLCKLFGHNFKSKSIALYGSNIESGGFILSKKETTTPIYCIWCKHKFTISEYRKLKRRKNEK